MSNGVYFITKCNERDGLFRISLRLAWFIGKYTDREGVTMTHNAKKCVKEFLNSDGMSIAAKNLKDAATSFSGMQQGCCPKNEVLEMFRRAYGEGTLVAYNEDGVVVGYRALTDFERDLAEERSHGDELRKIRQKKERTPKPSSRRRNPVPQILPNADSVIRQDDEFSASSRKPVLVDAS